MFVFIFMGIAFGLFLGWILKFEFRELTIETKRQELLCLTKGVRDNKYTIYTDKLVTLFYKGTNVTISGSILYEFANEGEMIPVNVTRKYKNGRDFDFEIIPLTLEEYQEIYGSENTSDTTTAGKKKTYGDIETYDMIVGGEEIHVPDSEMDSEEDYDY